MNANLAVLFRVGLGALLATSPLAVYAHPKPVPRRAAPTSAAHSAVAGSAALAVVRLYLADRLDQPDKAYALLSAETKAQFPASQRTQLIQSLTDPNASAVPPALMPVMALFADTHDTLHFKFRALGVSPDDPAIVQVRAYQVGMPLSTVTTLKVVTVADPDTAGVLRVDGLKTAMLAAPEVMEGRAAALKDTSQSNLKQLALGIMQYAQDHDEKMPDADRWVTEIMPYVKSEAMFQDPAVIGGKWGYAYNRSLSGVSLSDVDDPAATVLLFESATGKKNAADMGDSVPVAGRHDGGTNYAFVDGHIGWQADGSKPSFLLSGK